MHIVGLLLCYRVAYTGNMSDGREEREELKKRKEDEKPEERRDRLEHDDEYEWEPERGGS